MTTGRGYNDVGLVGWDPFEGFAADTFLVKIYMIAFRDAISIVAELFEGMDNFA